MSAVCWASITDEGPALNQHWANVADFSGLQLVQSSHETIG